MKARTGKQNVTDESKNRQTKYMTNFLAHAGAVKHILLRGSEQEQIVRSFCKISLSPSLLQLLLLPTSIALPP